MTRNESFVAKRNAKKKFYVSYLVYIALYTITPVAP